MEVNELYDDRHKGAHELRPVKKVYKNCVPKNPGRNSYNLIKGSLTTNKNK